MHASSTPSPSLVTRVARRHSTPVHTHHLLIIVPVNDRLGKGYSCHMSRFVVVSHVCSSNPLFVDAPLALLATSCPSGDTRRRQLFETHAFTHTLLPILSRAVVQEIVGDSRLDPCIKYYCFDAARVGKESAVETPFLRLDRMIAKSSSDASLIQHKPGFTGQSASLSRFTFLALDSCFPAPLFPDTPCRL